MITIIIKGSLADAQKAAEENDVPLFDILQHDKFDSIIAHTKEACVGKVMKWFVKTSIHPFPVGSCLWYGDMKAE